LGSVYMDGGKVCPLTCLGNPDVLKKSKIALICSVKCPGSVILDTYELMKALRNEDITVISGFHSPMERECLNILLRGTCGIVICYARSLPKRVPDNLRKPIDEDRLLLLSAFAEGGNRTTRASSAARNRLVAELGGALFVPYASPGGMAEGICKDAVRSGKPIFTFEGDHGASLQALGAGAIPPGAAAVLLKSVPQIANKPLLQKTIEQGLLKSDSPRGIWEISEAGQRWFQNNSKG